MRFVVAYDRYGLYETSPGRFSIRDEHSGHTVKRNMSGETAYRVMLQISKGEDIFDFAEERYSRPSFASLGGGSRATMLREIDNIARGGFRGRSILEDFR